VTPAARRQRALAALLGAALLAACASAASRAVPVRSSGGILVERASGMTLYTFDRDPPGVGRSVCQAACAANWPPLAAAADAKPYGDYTILQREDGTRQWAWKGRPLYRWSKDNGPGDRAGDGMGNLWRVARP
jgi:predicted lipoprotein with Yx(FWY)xxD motif